MTTQSLFPTDPPRSIAELERSALAVIDAGFAAGAVVMAPLYSGGHDSGVACHVASQHPRFAGRVEHIDTTIGAGRTRQHVNETCEELGWTLSVRQSPFTYERFVREFGFPGPGRHQWVYNRIKDRCVRQIVKGRKTALITGCRSAESVRRMGHVDPVQVGEVSRKTGEVRERNRIWVAPCHDWTAEEQQAYMRHHDLPPNPVKLATGMSGECWCGAFASPGEFGIVEAHCPDVAEKIVQLGIIARECGTHDKWGERPPEEKGLIAVESGPMCSSCDRRAYAAGLLFDGCE